MKRNSKCKYLDGLSLSCPQQWSLGACVAQGDICDLSRGGPKGYSSPTSEHSRGVPMGHWTIQAGGKIILRLKDGTLLEAVG
jgi:hypothetical protein